MADVPAGAKVVSKEVVDKYEQKIEQIEASNEEEAKLQIKEKYNDSYVIKEISAIQEPKKGFLFWGKVIGIYKVILIKYLRCELRYRENAKVRVWFGKILEKTSTPPPPSASWAVSPNHWGIDTGSILNDVDMQLRSYGFIRMKDEDITQSLQQMSYDRSIVLGNFEGMSYPEWNHIKLPIKIKASSRDGMIRDFKIFIEGEQVSNLVRDYWYK